MSTRLLGVDLLLDHEQLMKTAASLPPLPSSVVRLNRLFEGPSPQPEDVVRAVEQVPDLGSRLLHLASPVDCGAEKSDVIRQAVARLGAGTVRAVAMAQSTRPAASQDLSAFDLTPTSYWQHTIAVICLGEELCRQQIVDIANDFPLAALLHDFGKVILSQHLTQEHIDALHDQFPGLPAYEVEGLLLSVNHAEVSAVVAQGWDLPDFLVKSIQYHHSPRQYGHPLCHGLNVANQLAWRLQNREDDLRRECNTFSESLEILGIAPGQVNAILERGASRLQQTLEAYS
jgi:putative nucleotidyltransferase with HDIG domain